MLWKNSYLAPKTDPNMKRLIFAALLCAVLAGCSKEPEGNWYFNRGIAFFVENERGNNLLDPDYGGNILQDGISVTYKGERYDLSGVTRAEANGYEPPQFGGLSLRKSWSANVPEAMLFGDFGIVSDSSLGVREYRAEKLTINWGGESRLTSDIEFDLYTTSGKGERVVHQAIRVTGGVGAGTQSDNSLILTIVK